MGGGSSVVINLSPDFCRNKFVTLGLRPFLLVLPLFLSLSLRQRKI